MKNKFLNKLTFVLCASILVGCSGNPEEKVEGYIQERKYDDALEWLNEERAENLQDPIINALLSEVLLKKCIFENCFESDPTILSSLQQYQINTSPEVVTENGIRLTHDNMMAMIHTVTRSKQHPKAIIVIAQNLPKGPLKDRTVSLMFNKAVEHLSEGEIPTANALYRAISKLGDSTDKQTQLANLILSIQSGDYKTPGDTTLKALQSLSKNDALPEEGLKSIPYAFYYKNIETDPLNGAETFLETIKKQIIDLKIKPFINDSGLSVMASSIVDMSRNKDFLLEASSHGEWATPSPETLSEPITVSSTASESSISTVVQPTIKEAASVETPTHVMKLRFLRAAITVDPINPRLWSEFLMPAIRYSEKTGDTSLLFSSETGIEQLSGSSVGPYNDQIIALMKKLVENGEPILGLINKIVITTQNSEDLRLKIDGLLRQAMEDAVDNSDFKLIFAYANYQPDIAKLFRQKIVTLTINSLEKDWEKNNFSNMKPLSDFLTETMSIDFSLDSFILQSFDSYISKMEIKEKLSSDTPEILLEDMSSVKIPLGEKFSFMQDHFKDNLKVIDNVLKGIIISSQGVYGPSVALYRLFSYFDETEFPLEKRRQYLTDSIKNALSEDKYISALEFADIGYKIHKKHQSIPLSFIVDESLNRLKTLDEYKDLWKSVNAEFRETMRSVSPQYVILMEAIDAHDNAQHDIAVKKLTMLSDKTYVEKARPYLERYIRNIKEQAGVYLSERRSPDMHTLIIQVSQAGNLEQASDDHDILGVRIEFINAIGTATIRIPQQLVEDHGQTFHHTAIGRINPNTMEVEIPEKERESTSLPQSFESLFGNIRSIKFKNGMITIKTNEGTYKFNRVTEDVEDLLFPQGKYGMVANNNDGDTDNSHILPVGSIIELKTNKSSPLQPVKNGLKLSPVYPVKGRIFHPASSSPRVAEGFYNPETKTTSLKYTYPLGDNGAILEAELRCQFIDKFSLCGGHNTHRGRVRHNYLIKGKKIIGEPSVESNSPSKILPPPQF